MNRVVYVSQFSEKLKNNFEKEISIILQKSRKSNLELDITGLLVVNDNHFMQILEGGTKELEDLLTKISHDERHTHCSIIQRESITDRLYAKWSMAFKELEKNDLKHLDRIYSWDDIMSSAEKGIKIPEDKIQEVVRSFIIK